MVEDKTEEETYSLIFTSLKHPIRRKILRMLADKPLTYSEILEILNIDSGHLSYHLESLGDLTVHNKNGHYQLSSFGVATVKLMGGVEERTPELSHRKSKPHRILAKVYPVILALALIAASFHFVTYATVVSTSTVSNDQMFSYPLYVDAGQAFEVNVTLDHWSSIYEEGFGIHGGFNEYALSLAPLERTLTGWDEASVWIDSRVNHQVKVPINGKCVQLTMYNSTVLNLNVPPSFNETESPSDFGLLHMLDPNYTGGVSITIFQVTTPIDLSKLLVDVYTPNGTVITDNFHWTSNISSSDRVSSPSVPVTQPGTYRFRIKNDALCDWNGFLTVNSQLQRFEKPYFYWGIVGFIIALGYVIWVTASAYKKRHPVEKNSTRIALG
jgi:DNA-binding transcriptional ArsR family regulator